MNVFSTYIRHIKQFSFKEFCNFVKKFYGAVGSKNLTQGFTLYEKPTDIVSYMTG